MSELKKLAHAVWNCKYHLIWCPQYRFRILKGVVRQSVEEIITQLCEWKKLEILEMNVQEDHVHLVLSIPPKLSVSSVVGFLKRKCAIKIFDKHLDFKKRYWGQAFLSQRLLREYCGARRGEDLQICPMATRQRPANGADETLEVNYPFIPKNMTLFPMAFFRRHFALISCVGCVLFSVVYSDAVAVPYMFGVTIDDPWTDQQAINDALAAHFVKPTARLVFDEDVAAVDYLGPVENIHQVSYIMGEILDSFFVASYTVQQYLDRTAEYIDTLGEKVDIWEIGNEVNGDWLGSTADVKAKVEGAYTLARNRGKTTAINFYYNKACFYNKPDHEMFTWIETNVSTELKNGLDYVFFSYYEDDCEGVTYTKEQWKRVFDRLHALFPRAKIGFGEIGTQNVTKKSEYIKRYYSITYNEDYYVGGYFWWYYKEDCVPRQKSLWNILETTVVQAVTNPAPPPHFGSGKLSPAVNSLLLLKQ